MGSGHGSSQMCPGQFNSKKFNITVIEFLFLSSPARGLSCQMPGVESEDLYPLASGFCFASTSVAYTWQCGRGQMSQWGVSRIPLAAAQRWCAVSLDVMLGFSLSASQVNLSLTSDILAFSPFSRAQQWDLGVSLAWTCSHWHGENGKNIKPVWVKALVTCSSVALGKSFNLSEFEFSHPW